MGKIADKYFKVDPWMIIEEGFDPEYAMLSESVFSQANEYMGVRGYMEEGCFCERLLGSYFNGIYERLPVDAPGYKGMVRSTEFMVNSADWLYTEIYADGERLDIARAKICDFRRTLDFRTGLFTRSFIWKVSGEKELKVTFERILSMERVEFAAQRITVEALDFQGELEVRAGIDFSIVHQSCGKNLWKNTEVFQKDCRLVLSGETMHTAQKLCCAADLEVSGLEKTEFIQEAKKGILAFFGKLMPGKSLMLERKVKNIVCRKTEQEPDFEGKRRAVKDSEGLLSFEKILESNRLWWKQVWEVADIEIKGDPENQQGIRFCIFQLFQTYHGAVDGSNIGAKGLTGEAYNGNAFWDTETYCLPFFLFQNRKGAENLLKFRYNTLEGAKQRAKELDCDGAFYPIATISGNECCSLWQHANLQLQASTAVAYGIRAYEKVTGDASFMEDYGMEMLIEICRMLATRGSWFDDGTKYGYFCVMGPDEFQMMVNNNFYTNAMGKFVFHYTLRKIRELRENNQNCYKKLGETCGFSETETAAWAQMEEKMYLPYDAQTGIYEENDGFFRMPHMEIDEIPTEEFPLYEHWSYDRIYRNDMIKQPDVLMFMLMFNQSFDTECLRKNYRYYEPRCIHESSLSPSVHSILAAQIGAFDEAYELFRFATRMDLDNYNRNSGDGIHTTSIAAAWMNIVYGFGGFRSDGETYALNPTIPKQWESYRFGLRLGELVVSVNVEREQVKLHASGAGKLEILLYGEKVMLGNGDFAVQIPKKWRGV